jgi:hypothetical protein
VDAGIMIAAFSLWFVAVSKYTTALEDRPLECLVSDSYSFLSLGYYLFSAAALAKIFVLPVIGISFLVLLPLLYIMFGIYLVAGIVLLLFACLLPEEDERPTAKGSVIVVIEFVEELIVEDHHGGSLQA